MALKVLQGRGVFFFGKGYLLIERLMLADPGVKLTRKLAFIGLIGLPVVDFLAETVLSCLDFGRDARLQVRDECRVLIALKTAPLDLFVRRRNQPRPDFGRSFRQSAAKSVDALVNDGLIRIVDRLCLHAPIAPYLGAAIREILDGAPGYEIAGVDVLGEGRDHRVVAGGVLGREDRRVAEYLEDCTGNRFHQ